MESDSDDDVIVVEDLKVAARQKEKAKERENLGPWWKENEMKLRRERFL
jgi:hypothetical protein